MKAPTVAAPPLSLFGRTAAMKGAAPPMSMRLRQIAFAAADLDQAVADLTAVLALAPPYHDPGVAAFGLRNAVLAVGDTFLEIVSPAEPGSAAARYMARRGGDCGYMVMVQADDTDAARARAAAQGVRVAWHLDLDDIRGTHFHPRDLGGPLLSIDTPTPPAGWRWAGPDWPRHAGAGHARALVGVDMACADPIATAGRWAALLAVPLAGERTAPLLELPHGVLRFLPGAAPGSDGVVAIDLVATDLAAVLAAAAARGLPCGADSFQFCGTSIRMAAAAPPRRG